MALALRFRDHARFQRTTLHMTLAGALAGGALGAAALLEPALGPPFGATGLALLSGAAALGACPPRRRTQLSELVLLSVVTFALWLVLGGLRSAGAHTLFRSLALALALGVLLARRAEPSRR